jgi:hypothetical protein
MKLIAREKYGRFAVAGCVSRKLISLLLGTWAQFSMIVEKLYLIYLFIRSRVSSGSIVSDYGLYDRAIGVLSPAGATDFSSILCVQTGSGAHPASCPMGTGVLSPGVKARPGRDVDHSPPSSAEVVNELELYLLSPK